MSRIPREVELALRERAAGYCEMCHWPLDPEEGQRHHRKLRGMGGNRHNPEDTLENLVLLHPACHDRIHLDATGEARARHWIISRWAEHPYPDPMPWPIASVSLPRAD